MEPQDVRKPGDTPRWLTLTAFACLLVALPMLAAHVPARVKLLGIFPAVVGVAAGLILQSAQPRMALSVRHVRVLSVAIVPLVLGLFACESYRAWRAEYLEMFTAHLLAQPGGRGILDELNAGAQSDDPAIAQHLAKYGEHMDPPVAWYLDDRLSGLPQPLSARTATIITSSELVLAALAGIGLVFWNTRERRDRRKASPS